MQDPHKSNLVANLVGKWHQVVLPGVPKASKLFQTMFRWLDSVPQTYSNLEKDRIFKAFTSKSKIQAEVKIILISSGYV
jgi:hypothetical protein